MKVLDVGCGRGEVVFHCARLGIETVGIDYSQEVLEIAQRTKETHTGEERKRMRFICGDVKKLRTEDRFDRIFMLDLVEHLHDWELNELFQMCKELLKTEGQIIIHTLPNRWLYEITYRRLLRLFMPWLPKNPRNEKEMAIHVNEMSPTHLYSLLKRNGYTCRIWLHNLIIEQAKWHAQNDSKNRRGIFYTWIRRPLLAAGYRFLSKTPLRLLIVNDIFGIAVQSQGRIPSHFFVPNKWTESIVCRISNRLYG
jgi:cyclopropane fatty-acyl-phospholipid synthase-like methyltransferase